MTIESSFLRDLKARRKEKWKEATIIRFHEGCQDMQSLPRDDCKGIQFCLWDDWKPEDVLDIANKKLMELVIDVANKSLESCGTRKHRVSKKAP